MAEKKYIDVEVRETGLDELNEGLKQTEQNVDATGKSVDDVVGNGGAIAVLDQMTGGLATQFKNLYESTRLFNLSLKGTSTALIATGIGAFVVAAGLLVAYWEDIVDYIEGANVKLAKQNELIEKQIGYWSAEEGLINAQIKLAEAQGKSTIHLENQLKALVAIQIKEQERYIDGLKRAADEEEKDALRLSTWEKISGLFSYVMYGAKVEGKISKEEEGGIIDFLNKAKEAEEQLDILKLKQFELDNPAAEEEKKGGVATKKREDQETVSPLTGLTIAETGGFLDQEIHLLAQYQHKKEKLEKESKDAAIKIAEQEKEGKLDALYATGAGLVAMAGLLGQTTGAGKALASAGALINTYLGISNVWAEKSETGLVGAGLIQRIAATAAVAASGFAAVRNINKVQIPNTQISNGFFNGGGGATGGGTPSTPHVPDFNIIGQGGTNQLAELIAEQEQKPVRAYVVSEDIETENKLQRRIEGTATIG